MTTAQAAMALRSSSPHMRKTCNSFSLVPCPLSLAIGFPSASCIAQVVCQGGLNSSSRATQVSAQCRATCRATHANNKEFIPLRVSHGSWYTACKSTAEVQEVAQYWDLDKKGNGCSCTQQVPNFHNKRTASLFSPCAV